MGALCGDRPPNPAAVEEMGGTSYLSNPTVINRLPDPKNPVLIKKAIYA